VEFYYELHDKEGKLQKAGVIKAKWEKWRLSFGKPLKKRRDQILTIFFEGNKILDATVNEKLDVSMSAATSSENAE
jgi:hypothetical protein